MGNRINGIWRCALEIEWALAAIDVEEKNGDLESMRASEVRKIVDWVSKFWASRRGIRRRCSGVWAFGVMSLYGLLTSPMGLLGHDRLHIHFFFLG